MSIESTTNRSFSTLQQVDNSLIAMQRKEKELREEIHQLEDIDVPTAKYFFVCLLCMIMLIYILKQKIIGTDRRNVQHHI